jgi:hypothetical protein
LGLSLVAVTPSSAAVIYDEFYHMNSSTCNAPAYNCGTSVAADVSNVLIGDQADFGFQLTTLFGAATDVNTATWTLESSTAGINTPLPVTTAWTETGDKAYVTPTDGSFGGGILGTNSMAVWFLATADNATPSAAGLVATVDATAAGASSASFHTSVIAGSAAGKYVWNLKTPSGKTLKWTINVFATQVALDAALGVDNAISAAKTTSFLNAGEATAATADVAVSATMATGADQKATIVVTPKNAAGASFANATFPLTATIAGPGTLGIATAANVGTIASTGRAITGTAGQYAIGVFSDGTSGTATVTISTGTTVLATETVTFYGAAAKITPTVVNSVLAIGPNTGAVTAVVTDANGTLVPGVSVYASSDTDATIDDAYVASTAVSTTAGFVSFDLTGVAAGTAKITLTMNQNSAGTSTVSAVAGTMRVSDGTPTKVVYAFDKDTYAPGEAAKITATVSNAAGVMAAGTHTVLTTAVTANFTLAGLPGTLTVVSLASTGVATYSVTIPAGISGALTLTGVAATGVTATFGSTTIVNVAQDVAQAAADAAAEAIDAANAATDAANAAAEAADAATAAAQDSADAVAALSVQVSEQIAELKAQNDALRKQLIALTNLIIKIQKKVKA